MSGRRDMIWRKDFSVGDQVVCVDARPPKTTNQAPELVQGQTYTIAYVGHGVQACGNPAEFGTAVRLIEAKFPFDWVKGGFSAARFVLLSEYGDE